MFREETGRGERHRNKTDTQNRDGGKKHSFHRKQQPTSPDDDRIDGQNNESDVYLHPVSDHLSKEVCPSGARMVPEHQANPPADKGSSNDGADSRVEWQMIGTQSLKHINGKRGNQQAVQAVVKVHAEIKPGKGENRDAEADDRQPHLHPPYVVGDHTDADDPTVEDMVGNKKKVDAKRKNQASGYDHDPFLHHLSHRPVPLTPFYAGRVFLEDEKKMP